MTVVHGEVVDPETVIYCPPGHAHQARATADQQHIYGGVVRETPNLPNDDNYLVVDGRRLREQTEAAMAAERERLREAAARRLQADIRAEMRILAHAAYTAIPQPITIVGI